MSEKKRARKRKEEYTGPGAQKEIKPSKEEYVVAKWMKKNIRSKKTKFLNHNVSYFTASKALDALMKSHFSEGDGCLFSSREDAIDFLDIMLEHRFFHRAGKVPVCLNESKSKIKRKDDADAGKIAEKEDKATDNECLTENASEDKSTKEKRKRKVRLEMHADQIFLDGSEAYVWIYDPVPIYYWIYGTILVFGAIIICLFPLWPPILRKSVYYLSIAAAGFLVFIFALTVLRLIIFVALWLFSKGKLYFWIFPNLTEDVGFFASFWPLYVYEYRIGTQKPVNNKKLKKKKKKDRISDTEDNVETIPVSIEHEKKNNINKDVSCRNIKCENKMGGNDIENDNIKSRTYSESESEGSRCSTGKDFEMIETADFDTS